jgi:hypothetical protein
VLLPSHERDALDPTPSHAHRLHGDLRARVLGMRGEPRAGAGEDTAPLLGPDHLQRIAEAVAAFLLHLSDDDTATAPNHEIELATARADVRGEKPVAAEPIRAKGATLAAIHAASG